MERGTIMENRQSASLYQAEARMGGFARRTNRERVVGFTCDIADGNRLLAGIVEDISANGFKMTQVNETFQGGEHYYRTVVNGGGKHFKMLAKPCWRRASSAGLEIGFKILDVSWEWTELILTSDLPRMNGEWVVGNA